MTNTLRRWLLERLQPGVELPVRVLRSRWPHAVESTSEKGGRVTTVSGPAFHATLTLDARSVEGAIVDWGVSLQTRHIDVLHHLPYDEARRLYGLLQRQLLDNAPAGGGWSTRMRWGATVVAAMAIFVFAPSSHQHDGVETAARGPVASATAAALPAQRDPQQPRVNDTEMAMLQNLAGRAGVALADEGKPFYVFSDPNCPYCRQLERTLEKVGPGHKPVIIPVAYKAGSREVVQAVLCAGKPAEAARMWRQALATPEGKDAAVPGKVCAEGLAPLTDTMTLFEILKLTGTPAVITASGRMYSGASGATVEQLRAALDQP